MDIVDSQVHIGPGGAAEMVAAMNALGIKSVLNDEWWMGTPGLPYYGVGEGGKAIRTCSPTSELAAWTYPGRFSYLVRVDPLDPDLKAVIRFARDSKYVRALRISPGMKRSDIKDFANGVFDPVFEHASEYGLPIFLQIAGNADLLARVINKYPDSRVIICHCGMPPGPRLAPIIAQMEGLPDSAEHWKKVSEEPAEKAFEKVLRAADQKQVALKWAHAPVMFEAAGYPNLGARPYLKKALAAFGAERIMFASDISANQTGESWAELIFAIKENPELSQSDKEWILGKTARKWLNWEEE